MGGKGGDGLGEAETPFEVGVGDVLFVVKETKAGKERFVELVLPGVGVLLAEEDAAAQGTIRVDIAGVKELEGAAVEIYERGWEKMIGMGGEGVM